MRKLHWGLQSSPQHTRYTELLQLWQRADALGYDSAWLFDHFMPISGDRTGPCLEGWTLLAALAAQTHRLHVGCLVTGVIYRHPAVLAKMGATLDVISGGRLEMGLGAGWFEGEARAYGLPFPPTGQRLTQLFEAIQLIQALWTQPVSNFQGAHFRLEDARCEPKPIQQPHPAIWVGGQGERVTLKIVAARADGWDMDMLPLSTYDHKREILAGHCQAASRDPASVRRMIHFGGAIAARESEARARADDLARRWNTTLEDLHGRALLGTPRQAAEQLMPYVERGVEHFVLSLAAPYDMSMVELYINEVAPWVREMAGG